METYHGQKTLEFRRSISAQTILAATNSSKYTTAQNILAATYSSKNTVVLSVPPNSHEITVLLLNQCWKSQCFRQEMLF